MTTKRDRRAYYRQWAQRNRDKLRSNNQRYVLNNPERRRASALRYWRAVAAEQRDKTYNLKPGQYDAMVLAQEGKCAICQKAPSGKGRAGTLHVDHNHVTGAVRKLLCWRCNLGIGQFDDDVQWLLAAARYLEAHGP